MKTVKEFQEIDILITTLLQEATIGLNIFLLPEIFRIVLIPKKDLNPQMVRDDKSFEKEISLLNLRRTKVSSLFYARDAPLLRD